MKFPTFCERKLGFRYKYAIYNKTNKVREKVHKYKLNKKEEEEEEGGEEEGREGEEEGREGEEVGEERSFSKKEGKQRDERCTKHLSPFLHLARLFRLDSISTCLFDQRFVGYRISYNLKQHNTCVSR